MNRSLLLPAIFITGLLAFTPGTLLAIEMEDLMEDVLQGVRQETSQSIKQQVKTETQEVLAEEQVIPSNTRTGVYTGVDSDGKPFTCNLTFTGDHFTGTCTEADGESITISGSVSGNTFTVTYTVVENNPPCTGTGIGSGTITGNGEPGTVIQGTDSGDICNNFQPGSFTLTKQ